MSFEHAKLIALSDELSGIVALQKALNLTSGMLKEGMSEPSVFTRFPAAKQVLKTGIIADTIAVMVDLSPFSTVVEECEAIDVRRILSSYYDLVVPIIERHGGVVEKYIGDAIVALFGAPFGTKSTTRTHVLRAFDAARESILVVKEHFSSELLAKAAVSRGEMFLGYVGPSSHSELTAVGTPLTMLHRLEDFANPNEIVLTEELYNQISNKFGKASPDAPPGTTWYPKIKQANLRGIGAVNVVCCKIDVGD